MKSENNSGKSRKTRTDARFGAMKAKPANEWKTGFRGCDPEREGRRSYVRPPTPGRSIYLDSCCQLRVDLRSQLVSELLCSLLAGEQLGGLTDDGGFEVPIGRRDRERRRVLDCGR